MFTSIDKALVAAIMAVVFLANEWLGTAINLQPETVQSVVALLTPVLVWAIPNRSA